eukprot:1158759-Pelagomonas_calceolata.AAC.10
MEESNILLAFSHFPPPCSCAHITNHQPSTYRVLFIVRTEKPPLISVRRSTVEHGYDLQRGPPQTHMRRRAVSHAAAPCDCALFRQPPLPLRLSVVCHARFIVNNEKPLYCWTQEGPFIARHGKPFLLSDTESPLDCQAWKAHLHCWAQRAPFPVSHDKPATEPKEMRSPLVRDI